MLQWILDNGYPLDKELVMRDAAIYNKLVILQWVVANGCPWDSFPFIEVINHGHLNILRWAVANGFPWDVIFSAIKRGMILHELTILQWAVANCDPCDEVVISVYTQRNLSHVPMNQLWERIKDDGTLLWVCDNNTLEHTEGEDEDNEDADDDD